MGWEERSPFPRGGKRGSERRGHSSLVTEPAGDSTRPQAQASSCQRGRDSPQASFPILGGSGLPRSGAQGTPCRQLAEDPTVRRGHGPGAGHPSRGGSPTVPHSWDGDGSGPCCCSLSMSLLPGSWSEARTWGPPCPDTVGGVRATPPPPPPSPASLCGSCGVSGAPLLR